MNPHRGAGRPHRAGHRKCLGELGYHDLALQLEPLAVEGDTADQDRLTLPRAYAFQAAVIGKRSVTPGGAVVARAGLSTPASAGGSKSQALPWLPRQTSRQLQAQQLMLRGKRASVKGAGIVK